MRVWYLEVLSHNVNRVFNFFIPLIRCILGWITSARVRSVRNQGSVGFFFLAVTILLNCILSLNSLFMGILATHTFFCQLSGIVVFLRRLFYDFIREFSVSILRNGRNYQVFRDFSKFVLSYFSWSGWNLFEVIGVSVQLVLLPKFIVLFLC